MEFTFNIPELLILSNFPRGGTPYAPLLATTLNRLLRTRVQEEYKILLKEATEIVLDYSDVKTVEDIKEYGFKDKQQFVDLPIFQPLIFEEDDIKKEGLFLESAIVEISRTKTIVKTICVERDETVKELINNGDYLITVSGILCDKGWNYPLEKTKTFASWMNRKEPIKVNHEILKELEINSIVIEDFLLPKTPHINCQPYRFSASSDNPLPLIINEISEFGTELK